jgi:hypothetical protein
LLSPPAAFLVLCRFVLHKELNLGVRSENKDDEDEEEFVPAEEHIILLRDYLTSSANPMNQQGMECVDYMCQQDGGAKASGE